jgi:hydrogenase nickel incorporation protein HypA/HybF
MHELSIAMSIVELAGEESASRGARVSAVHLRLGRLSGVVKDALLGSYEIAAAGTPLEGSRLEIEEIPVLAYCGRCKEKRTIESQEWFTCPACGSPISEILGGKELEVFALELDQ